MDPNAMAGPMGPPDPGAQGQPGAPGGSAAPQSSPLYPPSVQHNVRILSSLATVTACFSGLVAGILGLTNLSGFFLYLITAIFSALILGLVKCGGNMGKYVAQSHVPQAGSDGAGFRNWRGWFALMGLGQENFLGFLLFWIGGYALIHVYD